MLTKIEVSRTKDSATPGDLGVEACGSTLLVPKDVDAMIKHLNLRTPAEFFELLLWLPSVIAAEMGWSIWEACQARERLARFASTLPQRKVV